MDKVSMMKQPARLFRLMDGAGRGQFATLAGFSVFVALVELGVTGMVSLLGLAMTAPDRITGLPQVAALSSVVPGLGAVLADQRSLLVSILALLALAMLVKNALAAFLLYRQSGYGARQATEFSARLFRNFLFKPYLWHLSKNSAELQTILAWRSYVANFLTNALVIATQAVIAVVLLAACLVVTPLAAATVFCTIAVVGFATYRFARTRTVQWSERLAAMECETARTTLSGLQGIREVAIYGQQAAFVRQFLGQMGIFAPGTAAMNTLNPLPSWVLEFSGMTLLLAVCVGMLFSGADAARLATTLTLLAAASWRLLPAATKAMASFLALRAYAPYLDPFLTALGESHPAEGRPSLPAPKLEKALRLDGLCFRYPQAPEDALKHVDLTVRAGSMVGIVGQSGSGKSTLVGVLTGLLERTAGSFTVDGQSLGPDHWRSWAASIGYVPQSPYLLDASIAENIAFSQWGEPVDRERVLECCAMAAMDFLDGLPKGVDTVIGERGTRLSGGQVQRVAIARALYHRPSLILFDEATSALDGAAELAIQTTINSLRHRMTMVVVAHRLSTVEACDHIYRLEDGRVVDQGPPEQVLPAYREALRQGAAAMAGYCEPEANAG